MKRSEHLKFFGQGFLGKNLADSLEDRGYRDTLRYSLDAQYSDSKLKMSERPGISFICVPTPNRGGKFDGSAVTSCIGLCHPEDIIVIRSTLSLGFLADYWDRHDCGHLSILYMPEFLDELTARNDIDNPSRNVIGVRSLSDDRCITAASVVMTVMPEAPQEFVCRWDEAALIKLGANAFFFAKNMMFNVYFDLSEKLGIDYETVRSAIAADPRIGPVHTRITDKGGRGAGGHCLPKDFRTLRSSVEGILGMFDPAEQTLFHMERRNMKLLRDSGKDKKIVNEVYG